MASLAGLAVLAYVAQMVIGLDMAGWLFWTITITGAVATLLTVTLANQRVVTAHQAAEAATRNQRKAFEDVLVPLALNLVQIASTTSSAERRALKQQTKLAIVALTANLIGPSDARACFLEETPDSTPGAREVRCLNNLWSGRGVAPVTTFRESDQRGTELLKLLDDGSSRFVPDVTHLPPALQPDSDHYRTYITCAVKVGNRSFGLLSVDCPRPGDLKQEDVTMVEVFARMLGVALA
ncbi:GAF domain-containing protein [Streptomyces sp. TG1A-8]|uniref:GAF domain-containing protein n=1 Tax=Streptomyces sp. TG1A-8 TaxID=3051385 RepID=UPI00265C3BD4|nr:GAF domain-containing protein [Streptomyces sp. TG1A-8]MDO0927682.1 GAF domain-containing protein [Streptomyces sp. TG1A-8]